MSDEPVLVKNEQEVFSLQFRFKLQVIICIQSYADQTDMPAESRCESCPRTGHCSLIQRCIWQLTNTNIYTSKNNFVLQMVSQNHKNIKSPQ